MAEEEMNLEQALVGLTKELRTPKVWASLGRTINTGNFENVKIDIGLTGIPIGSSDEYIKEQMGLAEMTLQKIVYGLANSLAERINEVRESIP